MPCLWAQLSYVHSHVIRNFSLTTQINGHSSISYTLMLHNSYVSHLIHHQLETAVIGLLLVCTVKRKQQIPTSMKYVPDGWYIYIYQWYEMMSSHGWVCTSCCWCRHHLIKPIILKELIVTVLNLVQTTWF